MAEVSRLVKLPSDKCDFRQQAITLTIVDPDLCHHMASLGHSELRDFMGIGVKLWVSNISNGLQYIKPTLILIAWGVMWRTPWTLPLFSQCSRTCGVGVKTRPVTCKLVAPEGVVVHTRAVSANTITVPHASQPCPEEERPLDRAECNPGSCSAQVHWRTGAWGAVSGT